MSNADVKAAPSAEDQKPVASEPELSKGYASKAEDGEEEEEEKEEGEEDKEQMEMAKKGCKKSTDLTGDDLEKSLQKLESIVDDGDVTSRKDNLLSKAQSGDDLSKSERDELFSLLGGEPTDESDSTSDELTKGLSENDTLQKALDVSDYLSEQHTELCKSLTAVGEVIEKSDARQHEYNLVLAKAVAEVGNLVKAVAETVGAIANQPARAPKSAGVQGGRVLNKSFAGGPSDPNQLSKSDIMNTLDAMMEKSMTEGKSGATESGFDLLTEIAKYEQTNTIAPRLLSEVKAFRNHAVAQ